MHVCTGTHQDCGDDYWERVKHTSEYGTTRRGRNVRARSNLTHTVNGRNGSKADVTRMSAMGGKRSLAHIKSSSVSTRNCAARRGTWACQGRKRAQPSVRPHIRTPNDFHRRHLTDHPVLKVNLHSKHAAILAAPDNSPVSLWLAHEVESLARGDPS